MKKIRHTKLPITLESSDNLTPNMLEAIIIQLNVTGWTAWKDEYGEWFNSHKPNLRQLELFEEK
jgi:hypothetical protein